MRATYQVLISDPSRIEAILQAGAAKARAIATPFMLQLRHAVGLRNLATRGHNSPTETAKTALPSFKQYREKDGQFYFKLVGADGQLLLQSSAMNSPKLAGQTIADLQTRGSAALAGARSVLMPTTATEDDIHRALQALAEARAR